MPIERGIADNARFALLGLLLRGPSHGYDLSRAFAEDSALGDILHLGQSNLYAVLTRMEREGLIAGEVEEGSGYPPRRILRLTAAGRDVVLHRLDEPVDHPRGMLIEFPLKLYIAAGLDRDRALALIARQRGVFERYLGRLEHHQPEGPEAAFRLLLRDARAGRARASIDWLDRAEAALHAAKIVGD